MDVGKLVKVRLGHGNEKASWYVKTLRMVDLNEGNEQNFEVDRWMSRSHDDKDVWRELAAQWPLQRALPSRATCLKPVTTEMART